MKSPPDRPLSILVVDDEELVRKFVARVLREAGYQTATASDGPEAIEVAATLETVDALVTDMMMPQMTGDELARRLRIPTPGIKVLYLTGFSDRLFKEKERLWADERFSRSRAASRACCRRSRSCCSDGSSCRRIPRRSLAEDGRMAPHDTVERLAAGIAHDFDALLNAIVGHADTLIDCLSPGDPRAAQVDAIRRAAEQAGALTQQLLAYSRTRSRRPAVLNLNAIVDGARPTLQRLVGSHFRVDVQPAANLACVRADPEQIDHVLRHLAMNARDAMPDGGVLTVATANVSLEAAAAAQRAVPAGDYVELAVTDTGVGIEAGMQPRLFMPSSRPRARHHGLACDVPASSRRPQAHPRGQHGQPRRPVRGLSAGDQRGAGRTNLAGPRREGRPGIGNRAAAGSRCRGAGIHRRRAAAARLPDPRRGGPVRRRASGGG
jgi:signal transduction histidine kinase